MKPFKLKMQLSQQRTRKDAILKVECKLREYFQKQIKSAISGPIEITNSSNFKSAGCKAQGVKDALTICIRNVTESIMTIQTMNLLYSKACAIAELITPKAYHLQLQR
ncbi:hypothetical protein BGX21_010812 [Mortierella sp. AD011]|nr:hypothetical protein BGX21_010812 [Mortierella sp. AD011]